MECPRCGSNNVATEGKKYCCRTCGESNISWDKPYEWSRLMYGENDELTIALKR